MKNRTILIIHSKNRYQLDFNNSKNIINNVIHNIDNANNIIQNQIVAIFMKGMSFGVVAMLLDVLIGLFKNSTKNEWIYPVCLIVFSFIYIKYVDLSIFFLVIICIVCALIKAKLISKKIGGNK